MKILRRAGLVLLMVGAICLLYSGLGLSGAMKAVQQGDCALSYAAPEGQGTFDPDQLPDGGISLFPVGLSCTWIADDGSAVTVYHGSWEATARLYGGLLLVVGGLVLVGLSFRPARAPETEHSLKT